MIRKALASTLIGTIAWTSSWAVAPGWAQSPPPHDHYTAAANRLEMLLDITNDLRSQIDRSQFDLDTLLEALDFDVEKILEFVAEEIYFEQYPGLLRGPQGTLMSRAGNALDQSVLLARLLKDAGLEARIAHGRLSPSQAGHLLGQLLRPRGPRSGPFKDPAAVEKILDEMTGLTGAHTTPPVEDYWQSVADSSQALQADLRRLEEVSQSILGDLASSGTEIATTSRADLAKEAVDYYWVEFKDAPSDPWTAAHPALARQASFEITPSGYFRDEVPEDLHHKFTLRAMVETSIGSQHSVRPIMDTWTRPAANLAGRTIAFSTVPSGMLSAKDPLADHRAAIEGSSFVVPVFNGGLPKGAMVFDLDGNVAPLDALTSSGEFIKQVSKKAAQATSAISALGSSEQDSGSPSGPSTTAVWVEFELSSPNGDTRSIRRHLLERTESGQLLLGQQPVAEKGWQRQAMLFLCQQRAIQVSTGTQPQSLAMDRMLERSQSQLTEIVTAMGENDSENTPVKASLEGLAHLTGEVDAWAPLWRFHALEITPTQESPRLSYRDRPAISSVQRGLILASSNPAAYSQTDLISSQRRSFRKQGNAISASLEDTLRAGILESRLEGPPRAGQDATRELFSAYTTLAAAAGSAVVLTPADAGRIDKVRSDPTTRQILRQELQAGNYLVVPEEHVGGADAWWRIDPGSGETLAMGFGPGGYAGIELAEMVTLLSVGLTLLFAYVGVADCKASYSGDELWCCLIDVLFFGSLFMLFTMVVAFVAATVGPPTIVAAEIEAGAISASAVAAAESIGALLLYDVPLNVVGISGILPQICDPADF